MPTAYIYRGTFEVRAGETLRYVEVAADGTISPEVTRTYAELAGSGSVAAASVSLTPTVTAPTLTGVQIGAIAGVSVSLQPTVSPAAVSGVQVGAIAAASVSLQPSVTTPSVTGVQTGTVVTPSVTLAPSVAAASLTGVRVGSISAAAVSCRPTVAVGSLAGVSVSAPTQPVISATGGNTQVTIALTSGGTGATSYDLKWGTSAGTRPNTIAGVTLPYTHTGRTNGTTYYYSLVATNAQGSTESAEVSAAALVPPALTEGFESGPTSWPGAGDSGLQWSRSSSRVVRIAAPRTGIYSLHINSGGGEESVSTTFNRASAGVFKLWLKQSAYGDSVQILIDGVVKAQLSLLGDYVNWTQTDAINYTSGAHTLTIKVIGDGFDGAAYVDDFTWST